MTIEQYSAMNAGLADREDYELVAGELIPLASGTPIHAEVRDTTSFFVRLYFRERPIGKVFAEIDCQLGPNTVRRADLSIFLGERATSIDMTKVPVPFAPDIVVEVLSPSEAAVDVHRKIHDYFNAGCQELWLMDALNGDIFVHASGGVRLLQRQHSLESALLPGFSVSVAELLPSTPSE